MKKSISFSFTVEISFSNIKSWSFWYLLQVCPSFNSLECKLLNGNNGFEVKGESFPPIQFGKESAFTRFSIFEFHLYLPWILKTNRFSAIGFKKTRLSNSV